jgi:hypothetical protein
MSVSTGTYAYVFVSSDGVIEAILSSFPAKPTVRLQFLLFSCVFVRPGG